MGKNLKIICNILEKFSKAVRSIKRHFCLATPIACLFKQFTQHVSFLLCWIVCSASRFCLRHSIGCLPPFFSSFVRSAVYSSVRPLVFLPPARLVCHMRFFVVVSRALCSYPPCPACPTHSVLSPVVFASLNHAPHVSLPPPRPCSRTHHRPRTSPAFARRVSGERASF